jgi:hypothetical protein
MKNSSKNNASATGENDLSESYSLQATGYRLQATGTVIKYAVDIAVEHLRGTRVMKSMELRRHV